MKTKARPAAATVTIGPQPGPQEALVSCPIEDLFYGGARGGGKTYGLVLDWLDHWDQVGENARGILFRRTYGELEEVIDIAKGVLLRLGWSYNDSKHTFTAPDGQASLKLRYLERNSHADRYQGHQYTWMAFDEAGNFPSPEPVDKLWSCLRSARLDKHGKPIQCVRRLTGNPGGVGQHWLKARYIDVSQPFVPFTWYPLPDEKPELTIESVFIPARLEDNLLLMQNDPGYEARIASSGGKALWKAWRYGDWDAMVGAVFDEWNRRVHVKFLSPKPHAARWAGGGDWGFKAWGWLGIAAFSSGRRCHVRKEWYYRGKAPYRVGYEFGELMKGWVAKQEIDWPEYIALDEDAFNVTDGGQSIGQRLQQGLDASLKKLGITVPFLPAPKGAGSRHTRASLLHEMLAWGPAETDKASGQEFCPPHLTPALTFHPDCKHAIRTIPALPADPHDSEDVDTDAEDHPYDGLTYLLITHFPELRDPDPPPRKSAQQHPGLKERHPEEVRRHQTTREQAPWEERYARVQRAATTGLVPKGGRVNRLPIEDYEP